MCAFVLPFLCLLFSHPLCLLISRKCVLLSYSICVCCPQTSLCLLISRKCVLSSSLILVHCTHTQTPLFFSSCLGSMCFSFIFSISETQSCPPRLYVFFFSSINTDVLLFWMKPYLEIWDHGLLKAWKHHQSGLLTMWKSMLNPRSLAPFTDVNILTFSCLF